MQRQWTSSPRICAVSGQQVVSTPLALMSLEICCQSLQHFNYHFTATYLSLCLILKKSLDPGARDQLSPLLPCRWHQNKQCEGALQPLLLHLHWSC